jgi:hypothetical protein
MTAIPARQENHDPDSVSSVNTPYRHHWVPVGKLKKGDHLKTPDGTLATADGGTTPKIHDGWMWDLTVPGNNDHDFYVTAGVTRVLVHNCDMNNPMSGFEQVSEANQAAWRRVAEDAREALRMAGLPAFQFGQNQSAVGAEIEIDLGDDAAGGLFVAWRPDRQLSQLAAESVRNGQLNHPSIRQAGLVSKTMRDAIISILNSAGFTAEESGDDLRPLSLRVVSGPSHAQ